MPKAATFGAAGGDLPAAVLALTVVVAGRVAGVAEGVVEGVVETVVVGLVVRAAVDCLEKAVVAAGRVVVASVEARVMEGVAVVIGAGFVFPVAWLADGAVVTGAVAVVVAAGVVVVADGVSSSSSSSYTSRC